MTTELTPDRIRRVSERSERAGYRLVRDVTRAQNWLLLDVESGEYVHSETSLDEVERWLDE